MGVVKAIFGGDSAAKKQAEQARRAAEAEQRRYEEQTERQKQMAMLEAAKQTENVVNVQTGGAGVVEDYLQGPKRKRTPSASSSLGIK